MCYHEHSKKCTNRTETCVGMVPVTDTPSCCSICGDNTKVDQSGSATGYIANLARAYAFWLDPGQLKKSSAPRDRLENAIEVLLENENEKLISVFRKINCRELSGTEAEGVINRILEAI